MCPSSSCFKGSQRRGYLTAPALDCFVNLDALMPTETASSGKLQLLALRCIHFHHEREEWHFPPALVLPLPSFSYRVGAVT